MTHKEIMRRSGCDVVRWCGYRAVMRNGAGLWHARPRADGSFGFVPSHETRLRARRVEYRKRAHPRLAEWMRSWEKRAFCAMSGESFATEEAAWKAIEALL